MKTINKQQVKHYTERTDILLNSMLIMVAKSRENYYAELEEEDLEHNMQTLFSELRTIRDMMCENNDALDEFVSDKN